MVHLGIGLRRALPVMICTLFLPSIAASEEQSAGQVLWVMGQAEVLAKDGALRPLRKGDVVREGDIIRTGSDAHAQLLMNDEALLAVRPDSSVKLTSYRYKGQEDGTENALVELAKGGLRSITGAIGLKNKKNYKLRTPMQTVGVRGTDHEAHFLPDVGTYDRVTLGGTYIEGASGRIDLDALETGFASIDTTRVPVKLERTPDFLLQVAAVRPSQNSGPGFRPAPLEDERRLERPQSMAPALAGGAKLDIEAPNAQAAPAGSGNPMSAGGGVGGAGAGNAWGSGGRCGGPCSDAAGKGNPGKAVGKGRK